MTKLKTHHYTATVSWTGNLGHGTSAYSSYSRNHEISVPDKPPIPASSDPAFRGDAARYSPEDLLLASLSGCHMLWYLHLCASNNIIVVTYEDSALGEMEENKDGSGQFTKVTLRPRVAVADPAMIERAKMLHAQAHKMCFIARSVNFPLYHLPEITCFEKA